MSMLSLPKFHVWHFIVQHCYNQSHVRDEKKGLGLSCSLKPQDNAKTKTTNTKSEWPIYTVTLLQEVSSAITRKNVGKVHQSVFISATVKAKTLYNTSQKNLSSFGNVRIKRFSKQLLVPSGNEAIFPFLGDTGYQPGKTASSLQGSCCHLRPGKQVFCSLKIVENFFVMFM